MVSIGHHRESLIGVQRLGTGLYSGPDFHGMTFIGRNDGTEFPT
jgi:hypothetical protein